MFSHKDFTGQSLIERDISPQEIIGSCFAQDCPDTPCFPPGMQGVTFVNCNLENCVIPEGNFVIGGETRRVLLQNDGNLWEVDENNSPLTVVDYLYLYKFGIPHPAPAEIPNTPVDKRVDYRDTTRNVRV